MKMIIDLDSELIVDRSRVSNPYLRLLLAAIGQNFAKGSPWVAVNKKVAAEYEVRFPLTDNQRHEIAAPMSAGFHIVVPNTPQQGLPIPTSCLAKHCESGARPARHSSIAVNSSCRSCRRITLKDMSKELQQN